MKKLALLLLILSGCALHAQSYAPANWCQLQTATGQAVPNAQVYFLTQPANVSTLTPQAQVYSSTTGGAVTQPLTTNGFGYCQTSAGTQPYLAPGLYTVVYVSSFTGTESFPDQPVFLPQSGSSILINPITGVQWPIASGSTLPSTLCPASVTGNLTSGSATVLGVSSFSNIMIGQQMVGTGIPAGTFILSTNAAAGTVTLTANATVTQSGVSLSLYSVGQPFQDTANNQEYFCSLSGWENGPTSCIDPRNPAFAGGARGDAVTDDTAALNAAFAAGRAQNRCVYLATPAKAYYVTAPLQVGPTSLTILGDHRGFSTTSSGGTTTFDASEILYAPTFANANRAVLDAVGHGTFIIDGVSILPESGTLAGTNIGSGIFSEPDSIGGGNLIACNNNIQAGFGAGTNAVAAVKQDLSTVCDSHLSSLGNLVLIGQEQGPNLTVPSFATAGAGYGVTHLVLAGNEGNSTLAPIEYTGSYGDLTISDAHSAGYFSMVNGGDNTLGLIDASYGCSHSEGSALNLDYANFENQSSATHVDVIHYGTCYAAWGSWHGGRYNTDSAGALMQGTFQGIKGDVGRTPAYLFEPGSVCANCDLYTVGPNALLASSGALKLDGSTIRGWWTSNVTEAALITSNSAYYTLCTGPNNVYCQDFGVGANPAHSFYGSTAYFDPSSTYSVSVKAASLTASNNTVTLVQGLSNTVQSLSLPLNGGVCYIDNAGVQHSCGTRAEWNGGATLSAIPPSGDYLIPQIMRGAGTCCYSNSGLITVSSYACTVSPVINLYDITTSTSWGSYTFSGITTGPASWSVGPDSFSAGDHIAYQFTSGTCSALTFNISATSN